MGDNLLDAKIVIKSKKNATWQGVLYVAEQEYLFRSEIDLLLHINKLVGGIDGYIGWAFKDENAGRPDEQDGN